MATKDFLGWVERQAGRMRAQLNLSPLAALEPQRLAEKLGATVLSPSDVPGLTPDDLRQLLHEDSHAWSAGTLRLPGGRLLIVINPTHAATRRRATLMEELAHDFLGHTPSQLMTIGTAFAGRTFKQSQETEASWVGAAALVPLAALTRAQVEATPREDVAGQYGVSISLVSFREKTTGIRL